MFSQRYPGLKKQENSENKQNFRTDNCKFPTEEIMYVQSLNCAMNSTRWAFSAPNFRGKKSLQEHFFKTITFSDRLKLGGSAPCHNINVSSCTFLDNDEAENTQISINNAATDRLSTTLAVTTWTIARVTRGQQQTNTPICQYTLLHWKALLVIATGDANHITLEIQHRA